MSKILWPRLRGVAFIKIQQKIHFDDISTVDGHSVNVTLDGLAKLSAGDEIEQNGREHRIQPCC
jgi:hypothetical protein